VYNGGGYSINAIIETESDNCVFPVVSGTILNLGTSGSITSKGSVAAGIARMLDVNGKIVNCYSTMTLSGNFVAGLVYNQYGSIANSYFGGSIDAGMSINALALKHGNGKFKNCYYDTKLHQFRSAGITGVKTSVMTSTLADKLNNGRSVSAEAAEVSEAEISYWKQNESGMPILYNPVPTVESIIVTPSEATVRRGESLQLSAEVIGEYNPSQKVSWELATVSVDGTSITADGLLTISETETLTSIMIIAKSKTDGSKAGVCTVSITE